jgi:predicted AlkP superfamily pyrophosphatase or phosphodiesterase
VNELMLFHQTHWTIDADTLTIIWQHFPCESIYDVYPLINSMNLKTEPLLLVFIDGLGYNMLENAKAHDHAGYFQHVHFRPMRTVYPPNTRNAYSAVGNGRHINSELFSGLGLDKAFIIENDRVFFTSRFPIILNTDRNNNGCIDDEIFASAIEHLDKEFELLVVHFHSIDDLAHEYGPYAERTMQQINIVSGYVQGLRSKWGRDMIIFSDHGLHSEGLRGHHGLNKIEDMVGILWK